MKPGQGSQADLRCAGGPGREKRKFGRKGEENSDKRKRPGGHLAFRGKGDN